VFVESAYEQGEFPVEPGDRLVFYTDGITEGRDALGDEYGEDRLADAAQRFRSLPAQEMLTAILGEVTAFNNATFEDDATLIVAAL
jgi:sigma-B regulation protein RsbU (phosphoserine phosphatase)